MNRDALLVQAARRACEAARHPQTGSPARQIVAVYVFADGSHAVASYGATKAECAAIRPTCDAIADAIEERLIRLPGEPCREEPGPVMTVTERSAGIIAEIVSAVGQNRSPKLSTKELEFLAWFHHRAYRLSEIAKEARVHVDRCREYRSDHDCERWPRDCQIVGCAMRRAFAALDGYEEGDAPMKYEQQVDAASGGSAPVRYEWRDSVPGKKAGSSRLGLWDHVYGCWVIWHEIGAIGMAPGIDTLIARLLNANAKPKGPP